MDATKEIDLQIGDIICQSSIYESDSWGFESDTFLNQVLLIHTRLSAEFILERILAIEKSFGRCRNSKYSARKIDIDILYIGNCVIKTDRLVVPHPRLQDRMFTLLPLVEIAEHKIHPVFKLTNKALLERTKDNGRVWVHKKQHAL